MWGRERLDEGSSPDRAQEAALARCLEGSRDTGVILCQWEMGSVLYFEEAALCHQGK